MNSKTLPDGAPFCYRAALTVSTTTVVPAKADYRAVITGYQISANVAAASTVTLQTITANEVALGWASGVATLADSCSGLYICSSEDEGWEYVAAGTITAGSITVWGVRIPNECPYTSEDTTFTP